ncbi:MAG: EscR/YscR/HrcR family type III secretion system export apparatus protein [Pseudomonadota bacterium]
MEQISPLVLAYLASFFLIALLAFTAFIKISVVLMIVRNAIGVQQVPSNMIVMVLSLFLAVFIAMPSIVTAAENIAELGPLGDSVEALFTIWEAGMAPFMEFISKQTDPEHLQFFVAVAEQTWADSGLTANQDMAIVKIPAFVLTELTSAFAFGFLLYLPFVAIDLAITAILIALGMQLVQPTIISVPFKILLFVVVDGWARLLEGLMLSYSVV